MTIGTPRLCIVLVYTRGVQSEGVKDKVFHALANLGIPLSDRQEISIKNRDISIYSEIEISLFEIEISLFEIEISLFEIEISLILIEISLFEIEISLFQIEISLFRNRDISISIGQPF